MDETHSSESYWAGVSFATVYHAVLCDYSSSIYGWTPNVWPFTWKLLSTSFAVCYVVQGGSNF